MTQYTEIIDKYLEGEMPPQEATAFEQQVETDPDLAYELKLHQLAIASVQHKEEARFQEFKTRMKVIESEAKDETPIVQLKPKRSGAVRWAMRIAAVLIPLLLLYFLFPFAQKQNNPLAVTSTKLIEAHVGGSRGEAPTPQVVLLDEAIQSFKQENYQVAITSFDQIIKENPDERATALYLKADALHRIGKKDEARKTLERICPETNDSTLCENTEEILKIYK